MASSRFGRVWLSDRSVWPIAGIMVGAAGLVGFQLTRHLFSSPDVYVGKDARKQLVRNNTESAKEFYDHGVRRSSLQRTSHIFEGLNAKYGAPEDRSHLPQSSRK